jgi:hypothetical protein
MTSNLDAAPTSQGFYSGSLTTIEESFQTIAATASALTAVQTAHTVQNRVSHGFLYGLFRRAGV